MFHVKHYSSFLLIATKKAVHFVLLFLFIFIVIQLMRSKQIDKKAYVFLWTIYRIVMLLFLFERDSFMQNIMNIIFFIPI